MHIRPILWLLLVGGLIFRSAAGDWPQFLGPTRNGALAPDEMISTWSNTGPKVLWSKPVGHGFSSVTVVGGSLILFTREGASETVHCLDVTNGAERWSQKYPTAYDDDFGFDDGPRATPCLAGNRVFTYGAEGRLSCFDLSTGKPLWNVDAKKQFAAPKGFFGIACSPLAEGDELLLNIGGPDAGVVAFDPATGKIKWKYADAPASYSSPVAATINGRRMALFFTRKGLLALDPADGKSIFEFSWHPNINASVSSATPLVVDDTIFISACYGAGAALLRIADGKPAKVWSGEDILSNHYATSVYRNGYLYGIHGRTDPGSSPEPVLRCVALKTSRTDKSCHVFPVRGLNLQLPNS
jgi:outer membrane protein assembly factor BamB